MTAVITGPFVRRILYHLHRVAWSDVWGSIQWSAGAVVALYLGSFIYHCFKRHDLDDPPRRLNHSKRRKISDCLSPFGRGRSPQVLIAVCQNVNDGVGFAQDIRQALVDAHWMAPSIEEADCRGSTYDVQLMGNWQDSNAPAGSPPMNEILKAALETAGVHVVLYPDERSWITLVVGERSGNP